MKVTVRNKYVITILTMIVGTWLTYLKRLESIHWVYTVLGCLILICVGFCFKKILEMIKVWKGVSDD